jgi:hypothetical protein
LDKFFSFQNLESAYQGRAADTEVMGKLFLGDFFSRKQLSLHDHGFQSAVDLGVEVLVADSQFLQGPSPCRKDGGEFPGGSSPVAGTAAQNPILNFVCKIQKPLSRKKVGVTVFCWTINDCCRSKE